ncbi:unannotated protein [freshwater metagenome]|uniref:Unannotated protein n=1 Tax=freshwater metagenome TaxID=449393 RepID=A0A6J6IFQ6_9ZZZZ
MKLSTLSIGFGSVGTWTQGVLVLSLDTPQEN